MTDITETIEENTEMLNEVQSVVDPTKQIVYQVLNCVFFIGAVLTGSLAQKYHKPSLRDMSDQWDIRLRPANWAFAIWGIIYTLILVFVIYQALPDSWASNRNNDVIFNQIAYWFAINFALNGAWMIAFIQNSAASFIISQVIILGMLATAIIILNFSEQAKLSVTGMIGLRIGFSIYSGWLTVATVLGFMFINKSQQKKEEFQAEPKDDTKFAVIVLYMAEVAFIVASFFLRDPLMAAVYIWALFAIRAQQTKYENIQKTTLILLIIHGCYIAGLTIWLSVDKAKNSPSEQRGLFY